MIDLTCLETIFVPKIRSLSNHGDTKMRLSQSTVCNGYVVPSIGDFIKDFRLFNMSSSDI